MLRYSFFLFFLALAFYFFPYSLDAEILNFRVLRAIDLCLVGSSLVAAGFVSQTIFRNDLADPFNLGISSFTGLGLVLASFFAFPLELGAFSGSLLCSFGMIL